jgi:hypothetical protein
LLGILMCGLLGIFAWTQGNDYLAQCRAMGVQPEGIAEAGRILGIVATILFLVQIAVVILGIMLFCGGILSIGAMAN